MSYRRTERVIQRQAVRHDVIVAAVHALAGESGLEGVQIAPVAARARIAVGTLYRYFPSKTALIAALVKGASAQDIAAIRRAADAAPGPLSALAAAVVAFAARALRHRRLVWAVMAELVDPEIDPLRGACRRALAAEFETRIRAAVGGGHLPEQDCALAAAVLVGALVEGLVGPLAPEVGDDAKAREAAQAVTLLLLRALGVVDARARGLVVQTAWPAEVAA